MTQEKYWADGSICLISNANDYWGKKNCHGGKKEKNKRNVSPMQRVEVKSGCAVPSVVNGEVLRRGSLSLVPRRPEALTDLSETNCERNIMWRAKESYLDALIYFHFSKTINQVSANFSFPICCKWLSNWTRSLLVLLISIYLNILSVLYFHFDYCCHLIEYDYFNI